MINLGTKPSKGKMIYHLTELTNLEGIFECNGLYPRNLLIKNNISFMDVADQEIIQFRKENSINDYVPFHFYVKNPFDGSVLKENPNMSFAIISMLRTRAREMEFNILPQHPKHMSNLQIYDYDIGIEMIDWDVMDDFENRDYRDREIKNICMAECIYNGIINLDDIQAIYVKNTNDENHVLKLKKTYNITSKFFINVNPKFFI